MCPGALADSSEWVAENSNEQLPLRMNQAQVQNVATAGPRQRPSVGTWVMVLLWLAGMVAAMAGITRYSFVPGRAGAIPAHWPAASGITLAANQPTLILFAHPHCPCTQASIGELARLMANCQGTISAQGWFVKPVGTAADWTNTDLWASAARIPDVTVHCDEAGAEARRFEAVTSGQTVLYNQSGELLFHGGITIARGHFGDNPGAIAVKALVNHQLTDQIQTPVFGCSLLDEECRPDKGGGTTWKP